MSRPMCKTCGGEGALNRSGSHYLCDARIKRGLPAPRIEPKAMTEVEAEAFKIQQAKEMSLCWGVIR